MFKKGGDVDDNTIIVFSFSSFTGWIVFSDHKRSRCRFLWPGFYVSDDSAVVVSVGVRESRYYAQIEPSLLSADSAQMNPQPRQQLRPMPPSLDTGIHSSCGIPSSLPLIQSLLIQFQLIISPQARNNNTTLSRPVSSMTPPLAGWRVHTSKG